MPDGGGASSRTDPPHPSSGTAGGSAHSHGPDPAGTDGPAVLGLMMEGEEGKDWGIHSLGALEDFNNCSTHTHIIYIYSTSQKFGHTF